MAKRTKKVGVTGRYGTRYGSSIRKIVKKFELQQHAKYVCPACGKVYFSSLFIDQCQKKSMRNLELQRMQNHICRRSILVRYKRCYNSQSDNEQTQETQRRCESPKASRRKEEGKEIKEEMM